MLIIDRFVTKSGFVYFIITICVVFVILMQFLFPFLKNTDGLMLLMQGLNIIVFLHISYMLSKEDKRRYVAQQKFDDERLRKQLKFDLVKKNVDEFDFYLNNIKKNVEFLDIVSFYRRECFKLSELSTDLEQKNLKLMNIFNNDEYDIYIYIQSKLMNDCSKFKYLMLSINNHKKYTKDDSIILDIDDAYIDALSHLVILSDYLYYILLHDSKSYELENRIDKVEMLYNKRKLRNIDIVQYN